MDFVGGWELDARFPSGKNHPVFEKDPREALCKSPHGQRRVQFLLLVRLTILTENCQPLIHVPASFIQVMESNIPRQGIEYVFSSELQVPWIRLQVPHPRPDPTVPAGAIRSSKDGPSNWQPQKDTESEGADIVAVSQDEFAGLTPADTPSVTGSSDSRCSDSGWDMPADVADEL